MANAPRPGTTRRDREDDQVIRIRIRDETVEFRPGDYGPRDDAMVRKEMKMAGVERMSLVGVLAALDEGAFGMDLVCLLHWLVRRKQGLTTISYGDALDAFPTLAELSEDDIEVTVEEPDDDGEEDSSPEA